MKIFQPAYDKLYLEDILKIHACLFSMLSKVQEYSVYSMIDVYMQHSIIRQKMDQGNWSALNKGSKQLFNSVDFSLCTPREEGEEWDDILLGWMAEIYVLLQWHYNLPSATISELLPARELCKTYNPLHETSHKNACEKLYHKYLAKTLQPKEEDYNEPNY